MTIEQESSDTMTRTELGCAYWKESPRHVKDARAVAAANIAIAKLKHEIIEAFMPAVRWIESRLTR